MLMDLVDALSSNTTAKTAVELTLNPHFRRHYTALNKAVKVDVLSKQKLAELARLTMAAPSHAWSRGSSGLPGSGAGGRGAA